MFKLFKKKPPRPNLEAAFKRAQLMAEAYNEFCYYVSQIPDLDQPVELFRYLERADYQLCSVRDELQILYRRSKEQRHVNSQGRPRRREKNSGHH